MIYAISYKTLIDSKPLCIRFDKTDGFIRIYDGTRYLILFGSEIYDTIYNRITYLISLTSDITYILTHCYAKIKADSYDFFTYRKTLTLHNVIIIIKSALSKDRNLYYYEMIFLKKFVSIS